MWVELQNLLEHGATDKSYDKMREAVVEGNVLAKRTTANRRQAWRKLVDRYCLRPDDVAFAKFLQVYYGETSVHQRALLAYLLFSWNNALARRISLEWLSPQLHTPGAVLDRARLREYFDLLCAAEKDLASWAEATKVGFLKQYLGAIRDFGLAEGKVTKRVLKPVVGSNVVLYALHLARIEGVAPRDMLKCEWFRLLGVDLDWVIEKLYSMNAEGVTKFRIQGDVVDLQFNGPCIGEN